MTLSIILIQDKCNQNILIFITGINYYSMSLLFSCLFKSGTKANYSKHEYNFTLL